MLLTNDKVYLRTSRVTTTATILTANMEEHERLVSNDAQANEDKLFAKTKSTRQKRRTAKAAKAMTGAGVPQEASSSSIDEELAQDYIENADIDLEVTRLHEISIAVKDIDAHDYEPSEGECKRLGLGEAQEVGDHTTVKANIKQQKRRNASQRRKLVMAIASAQKENPDIDIEIAQDLSENVDFDLAISKITDLSVAVKVSAAKDSRLIGSELERFMKSELNEVEDQTPVKADSKRQRKRKAAANRRKAAMAVASAPQESSGIDDEVFEDYIANADIDLDFPVSNLAALSIALKDSDGEDFELAESALYEYHDGLAESSESYGNDDVEGSLSLNSVDANADDDDHDYNEKAEERYFFEDYEELSGESNVSDNAGKHARWAKKVDEIMQEDIESPELQRSVASKSALKKQAKRDAKVRRGKLREEQKKRESENSKLAKSLRKGTVQKNADIKAILVKANLLLHDFVIQPELESIILPPVVGQIRRVICELCKMYKLLPKTRGSGKSKILAVFRTGSSFMPTNWKTLGESMYDKYQPNPKPYPSTDSGTKKTKATRGKIGAPDDAARPMVGDIIGASSKVIGGENLGHKMMLMMGWKPGDSLGASSEGILEPIQVTVRARRSGLGG